MLIIVFSNDRAQLSMVKKLGKDKVSLGYVGCLEILFVSLQRQRHHFMVKKLIIEAFQKVTNHKRWHHE